MTNFTLIVVICLIYANTVGGRHLRAGNGMKNEARGAHQKSLCHWFRNRWTEVAACLKQLDNEKLEEVVVFESRDNFLQARLGGGIQLSGGSAVLERIGYLNELDQAAEVMHTITSRNSKGDTLIQLDVDKLIRENAPKQLCAAKGA